MRIVLILSVFLSSILNAQNYTVVGAGNHKFRNDYSFYFNRSTKLVDWLGYTVSKSDVDAIDKPLRVFHKDSVEEFCPTNKDYEKYAYTKGLLKPRSASRGNSKSMYAAHNLLNVAPMDLAMYKGAWRVLDNMIAGWAVIFDSVHVVTGPVFTSDKPERIGDAQIRVPDAFYKVVLVRNGLDLNAIGFIIPNNSSANELQQYSMPIDSVEKVTGLDFFAALPDYLEMFTEEKFDASLWKDQSTSYQLKASIKEEKRCVAATKSDERCTTVTNCVSQNCWKHGCDIKEPEK